MNDCVQKRLKALDSPSFIQSLSGIQRGFEKECLRTDNRGRLARTPHPQQLGSSLMHPMITTDYSEALLEFITPPSANIPHLFQMLEELHAYTYSILGDERLWVTSMPCELPPEHEIPIARYGTSNLGRLKHIYRMGLGHRYGRYMQTIAGIHYNFSFSVDFWKQYTAVIKPNLLDPTTTSLRHFISEQYLGLIRNAMRLGWIMPLLFGASPAIASNFLQGKGSHLQKMGEQSLFLPHATSLRLSDLGYSNRVKPIAFVSHNSFSEFIKTMRDAVQTPHPEFARFNVKTSGEYQQLSDSILQVEDEHYAPLRPKRVSGPGQRMLDALSQDGIEYIEVRALDIDPFLPIGICPDTIHILDAFLMLCLLMDSPPLTSAEEQRIQYNHATIVKMGRAPTLTLLADTLTERSPLEWGREILESLTAIRELLDKAQGISSSKHIIQEAHHRLSDMQTLPSARILAEMQAHQESHGEFANRWSHTHQEYFKHMPLSPERLHFYTELSLNSLKAQKEMEHNERVPFEDFLRDFLA